MTPIDTHAAFTFTPIHPEIDPYLRAKFREYAEETQYAGPAYSPSLRAQSQASADATRRLIEDAIAAWKTCAEQPAVRSMRRIVARSMQAYQADFYIHDMAALGRSPATRRFLWMVRPTGTWLVWQDDDRPEPRLILDEARRGELHQFYRGSVATRLVKVADPATLRLG